MRRPGCEGARAEHSKKGKQRCWSANELPTALTCTVGLAGSHVSQAIGTTHRLDLGVVTQTHLLGRRRGAAVRGELAWGRSGGQATAEEQAQGQGGHLLVHGCAEAERWGAGLLLKSTCCFGSRALRLVAESLLMAAWLGIIYGSRLWQVTR